jgi:hypothetical protein
MESLDLLFAVAIVIVVAMGAFALFFLLRRASRAMKTANDRQAEARDRFEKALALQRDALDLARESVALQRETNRLLAEMHARSAPKAAAEAAAPAQQETPEPSAFAGASTEAEGL